jgi:hypothetical protein
VRLGRRRGYVDDQAGTRDSSRGVERVRRTRRTQRFREVVASSPDK